jgi:GMP reductase
MKIQKEGLVASAAQVKSNNETKFDFNDILIKPVVKSKINSRKDITPFVNGYLPLITAPMDTVIDKTNEKVFENLKIITCSPRGVENKSGFTSFSLSEFEELHLTGKLKSNGFYLIDIANGHMSKLIDLVKKVKTAHPKLVLMVGNIANPKTYELLSLAGADFIRVGIGNGGGCSTTVHTGIGYPMASLISECYTISKKYEEAAYIVADGGMQNYSDVIKALALGSDFVMIGSLFNKAIDSCGENYLFKKIWIPQEFADWCYEYNIPVYKKFRGMSTKEVQKKWGKEQLTTSEGVIRFRKAEYTLKQWVNNFEDYLRSAMSYSNAKTLNQFIGKAEIIKISDNAYNRFKK